MKPEVVGSICQLNPKESSYSYFIAHSSTTNFKLAQQTIIGHVSSLAMDAGTISHILLLATGRVALVMSYKLICLSNIKTR